MLKEFFLVDYNSINSFKDISTPLLDLATESFLLIAAIFELYKGFIGKSNPESRITIFILAAISMTVFNQYNQKVLDVSFETSDKILSKLHITSMSKISDVMKSSPSEQVEKNNQNLSGPKKSKNESPINILGEAKVFMANNLAIAIAWLISVIAISLSKILFTVIYYALIVLAPVIIFISVFPGYESSLKTFWQTFIWCFLAPIVFSVIFVLMHLIAQKETPSGTGLEALVGVLLYGIFLVGSFVMTYKISTSQPISGFAEHASMIGAMAMAAPFTAASGFAQSAIHSPLQTYNNTKQSLGKVKSAVEKLSKGNIPHSGIGDISKMNNEEIEKKFGSKSASKMFSERAKNDYHGNKFGLSTNENNQNVNSKSSPSPGIPNLSTTSSGNNVNVNKSGGSSLNTQNSSTAGPNSIQSLKSKYQIGVNNIEDRKLDLNPRNQLGVSNIEKQSSKPMYQKVSPNNNGSNKYSNGFQESPRKPETQTHLNKPNNQSAYQRN
jgi:hypothetical protein